jgi:hypothetical protein
MLRLADIWQQMACYGLIKGFWRGIVLTDRKSLNFGKIGTVLTDFDFDSEKLRDNLLDAAWAAGELRLDQEGYDAASN